jgi:AmiR/NasT family two-component response regulator
MNSKRILVVDDQLARALRLRGLLHEAGYPTSWAESAADAMVTACRERPVLTLIEARLPNQSAVPLGGMLRDQLEAQWACVVDQTADIDEFRRTASSGALALIIRPADLRLVAPTVDTAVACAVEIHRLRETGRQLHEALEQSRTTSFAAGILMERFRLDRHRAIGLLRDNARSQRRRLADIAEEVLASVERINGALGAPRGSNGMR